MKVSELGEFGLIERLARMVDQAQKGPAISGRQIIIGIGDDAAAWQGDAADQLATVDGFIQDVHFTLNGISWRELGWKALAANLSDIAAMGGTAQYALIALALPNDTEVDDVTELYQGIIELANEYRVAIAGGDMSTAPLVAINITVIGRAPGQGKILTRRAAQPGDRIAVTGYLGTAAAGLEMLTKKLQFDPEAEATFRKAFLHPQPRIAEGQLLVKHGVKTAIDISDGLISDLNHILRASQAGARLEVDRIPIHPAVKANFGNKAIELALSGGEDYELLFTGSAEIINRVTAQAACPVTVIGEIEPGQVGKIGLVGKDGRPYQPGKAGWQHFVTE